MSGAEQVVDRVAEGRWGSVSPNHTDPALIDANKKTSPVVIKKGWAVTAVNPLSTAKMKRNCVQKNSHLTKLIFKKQEDKL